MTEITIDIETIPSQHEWVKQEIEESIKPPGNYKKEETIQEWIKFEKPKLVEEAYRRTALDGGYGQVICIGMANGDNDIFVFPGNNCHVESEIITSLFSSVTIWVNLNKQQKPKFIGHNVMFDLRFIMQRAIINGIKIPHWFPVNPKPWDDCMFDTAAFWCGQKGYISLNKLCRIFNLQCKGEDLDGSKVWDFYQAGRLEEIAEYCKADVNRARSLYKIFTGGINGV